MITFRNVTKEYMLLKYRKSTIKDLLRFKRNTSLVGEKKFFALRDVSFSVKAKSAVGVLGKNGAGKSTLLKLLTGIMLPTSGEIHVGGKISSLLEASAGFHPDLSGRENIFLSGAILGMSDTEVSKRLESIVDFSGIGEFLNEPVKHYSSGMLIRLAFSIGVNLDSDILVIDEALAVGDAVFREKCFNRINQIKEEGRTIFFVSHDVDQVRNICDTCIVLDGGSLVYEGDIDTAIQKYNEILEGM